MTDREALDRDVAMHPGPGIGAWRSVRDAVSATRSFALTAFVFGLLFGSAAASLGMPAAHAMAMSIFVFAGSAQFPALELWAEPLPLLAIAVSTVLVTGRHTLMGMTLPPILQAYRPVPRYAALVLLTDANWVLTLKAETTPNHLAFLAASGACMFAGWVIGTALGLLIPDALDATTAGALGAAGTLFLAVLMMILVKGNRGPRAPWIIAGLASVGLERVMPGALALPVAVALGAAVAVVLELRRHAR